MSFLFDGLGSRASRVCSNDFATSSFGSLSGMLGLPATHEMLTEEGEKGHSSKKFGMEVSDLVEAPSGADHIGGEASSGVDKAIEEHDGPIYVVAQDGGEGSEPLGAVGASGLRQVAHHARVQDVGSVPLTEGNCAEVSADQDNTISASPGSGIDVSPSLVSPALWHRTGYGQQMGDTSEPTAIPDDHILDIRVRMRGDQRPGIVAVTCFCSYDPEQVFEATYGNSILGSFYDSSAHPMKLDAPCQKGVAKEFRCAEAAFHALQFWALASGFARLSGLAAQKKSNRLAGHADPTFAGYGNAWTAMLAVLTSKFADKGPATALLTTGDSFLLCHDPGVANDNEWSGGHHGEGRNMLGVLLMLVRDRLSGASDWTMCLSKLFDLDLGDARTDFAVDVWQQAVRSATTIAWRSAGKVPPTAIAHKEA